jgi:hypothetical protein
VALVVEVQQGIDRQKQWTWPAYLAGLRARRRCDVMLVVVALSEQVAAWARKPRPLGHPGLVLTPLVLGAAEIPVVREGVAAPAELAVLSTLAHGRGPEAESVGRAALAAVSRLDEERARFYADLVLLSVHDAARASLEAMMRQRHEYQSDFARRYFSAGKEEGREEGREAGREEGLQAGRLEGLAHAVLALLASRGLALADRDRFRVLSCADVATLEGWLLRAASARSMGEVVGDEGLS